VLAKRAGRVAGAALLGAAEISARLTDRLEPLVEQLLPGGRREGGEWRCGSLAGEGGGSLGVRLTGGKRGLWADFATGQSGDALDLVRLAHDFDMPTALAWSRSWLGISSEHTDPPPAGQRPAPPAKPAGEVGADLDPDRWRPVWHKAQPIAGTLAERYLAARGVPFADPNGETLRFAPRRRRCNPAGEPETHPAMLALLRDACTGEPCGIINVYLLEDGRDRLRDRKGKTASGRARGACVMLDPFEEPTMGLALCEGVETGIAVYQSGLRPVWACGGASTLASFPVLSGIEALTIAADQDEAGMRAAATCADRWHEAGRKTLIIAPPSGDWAEVAA
jgi:putative DNA primase/helicase